MRTASEVVVGSRESEATGKGLEMLLLLYQLLLNLHLLLLNVLLLEAVTDLREGTQELIIHSIKSTYLK